MKQELAKKNSILELNRIETISYGEKLADHAIATKNTFQVLVEISKMKLVMGILEKRVREDVAKQLGTTDTFFGAEFKRTKGRTTWDFSTDPTWTKLNDMLKKHETYLKTLKGPTEEVDPTSGEVITYYPPVKTQGDDTITVTLK